MAFTLDPIQRSLNRRKALLGNHTEAAQTSLAQVKANLLEAVVFADDGGVEAIKTMIETIDILSKDVENRFRSAIIAYHNSREFKGYDD